MTTEPETLLGVATPEQDAVGAALLHSEVAAEVEPRLIYTISVDLDGVLNSYSSGWDGPESLPDPPTPGAIEWLQEMLLHFNVAIWTTRANIPDHGDAGIKAVWAWLEEHGFEMPPDAVGDLEVTAVKGPALIYVDDRAWRYNGDGFPTAGFIRGFRPWWNRKPPTEAQLAARSRRANVRNAEWEKMQALLRDRKKRITQLEQERAELRTDLLLEVLDVEPEVAAEWMRQNEELDFPERLVAARALQD